MGDGKKFDAAKIDDATWQTLQSLREAQPIGGAGGIDAETLSTLDYLSGDGTEESPNFVKEGAKSFLRGALGATEGGLTFIESVALPNVTRAAMNQRGVVSPRDLAAQSAMRRGIEKLAPHEGAGFWSKDLPEFAGGLVPFLLGGEGKAAQAVAGAAIQGGGAMGRELPIETPDEMARANLILQSLIGASMPFGPQGQILRKGAGEIAPKAFLKGATKGAGYGVAFDTAVQGADIATVTPDEHLSVENILRSAALMGLTGGATEGAKSLATSLFKKTARLPSYTEWLDRMEAEKTQHEPAKPVQLEHEAQQQFVNEFAAANGQSGVEPVAPRTQRQREAEAFYRERGLRAIFVRGKNDVELTNGNGETSKDGKTVVFDSNMSDADLISVALGHELTHAAQTGSPEAAKAYEKSLNDIGGTLANEAGAEFESRSKGAMSEYLAALGEYQSLKKELAKAPAGADVEQLKAQVKAAKAALEEAYKNSPQIPTEGDAFQKLFGIEMPAHASEQLAPLAWAARTKPAEFGRFMFDNYDLWTRVRGVFIKFARGMGLTDKATQWEKDAQTLLDVGVAIPDSLRMQAAGKLANVFNDMVDTLIVEPHKRLKPLKERERQPDFDREMDVTGEVEPDRGAGAGVETAPGEKPASVGGYPTPTVPRERALVPAGEPGGPNTVAGAQRAKYVQQRQEDAMGRGAVRSGLGAELEPVQRMPAKEGVAVGAEHPLRHVPLQGLQETLAAETAHEAKQTRKSLLAAGWTAEGVQAFERARERGRAATTPEEQAVAHGIVERMKRRLTPEQRAELERPQGRFGPDEVRAAIEAAKEDKKAWQMAARGNEARAAEQAESATKKWSEVGAARTFALKRETPQKWKALPVEKKMADAYEAENGIRPYLSQGQIAVDPKRFAIKRLANKDKQGRSRGFDAVHGLPLNSDSTVTLYMHASEKVAREFAKTKKLVGETAASNRIELTNESSAKAVGTGRAVVSIHVDPDLLHLVKDHGDGRKDFFIQLAEGAAFAEKMSSVKLHSMVKGRAEAIDPEASLVNIMERTNNGLAGYLRLAGDERKAARVAARNLLINEHNFSNLLTENGKLEKSRAEKSGIEFLDKSVESMGIGLASAQKLGNKATTCPKSASCEGLCLGDTSGGNKVYGGVGSERVGPRLSQYLKTEALVMHPEEFIIEAYEQIRSFADGAIKRGNQPAIRMNVTSDIHPRAYKTLFDALPDVQFYDYTKLPGSDPIAPNHHLTYSLSGVSQVVGGEAVVAPHSNWDQLVEQRLMKGQNVAMPFTMFAPKSGETPFPKEVLDQRTGERFKVISGDKYDARFVDPKDPSGKGVIVALANKDMRARKDASKSYRADPFTGRTAGFFVHHEGGETVTIPNQKNVREGGPFALKRLTAKRVGEVAKNFRKAMREGEETTVGDAGGYLASASGNATIRAFQRAVRQVRASDQERVTLDEQARLAEEMLKDPETPQRLLDKARNFEPFTAAETVALNEIKDQATRKVLRKVWDSPEEMTQAFRDATRWNLAYQDARTEAGRTLGVIRDALRPKTGADFIARALEQPSKYLRDRIAKIKKEMEDARGERRFALKAQLEKLYDLAAKENQDAVLALQKKGWDARLLNSDYYADPVRYARDARTIQDAKIRSKPFGHNAWDMAMEMRIANMLSAPATTVVNDISNTSHIFYEGLAKRVAEATVNLVARDPNAASFGEVAAYMRAWFPALGQAGKNFLMAYRTELPSFEVDLARRGVEVPGIASRLDLNEAAGHAIPGMLGRIWRFPSLTTLLAHDEFFKTLAANTEAAAIAHRLARGDRAKMQQYLADMHDGVWTQALENARKQIFQDRPDSAKEPVSYATLNAINTVRNAPLLGPVKPLQIALPFLYTPFRVFQRGLAVPFHPLVMLSHLAKGMYSDKALLTRDIGTLALTSGITSAIAGWALAKDEDGLPLITGSQSEFAGERGLQQRTAPAMSIRVGGSYYSYNRFDPASVAITTIVDAFKAARDKEGGATTGFMAAWKSVYQQTQDKTFLRSLGDISKALEDPEGSKNARLLRDIVVTPMVPFSSLVRSVGRAGKEFATSDSVRKHDDEGPFMAAMRSLPETILPGSTEPELRYDLLGREVKANGRTWAARFLPIAPTTQDVKDISQIDRYIVRYNDRIANGDFPGEEPFRPMAPKYFYKKDGETKYFTDEEYARLQREAGRMAAESLMDTDFEEEPTPEAMKRFARVFERARKGIKSEIIGERDEE